MEKAPTSKLGVGERVRLTNGDVTARITTTRGDKNTTPHQNHASALSGTTCTGKHLTMSAIRGKSGYSNSAGPPGQPGNILRNQGQQLNRGKSESEILAHRPVGVGKARIAATWSHPREKTQQAKKPVRTKGKARGGDVKKAAKG